ncbi:MAG: B12-binding domain-containing radical SAM protein [Candidatus Eisenbacteria bacterium]|uniref:B12-binding domain-containing radical SAM protein n=1 Tax=Eiseniibacteriota bacterium TaxID=2212470 RepID=A0A937X8Y3_UNCEI|nr:B12-binding domain-containing radical SAM protein [Candidatus Eisenbacteria bacterium]
MRVALLFPPPAAPSYAPLGLAMLAAHLRRAMPEVALALLDGNLAAWDFLALRHAPLGGVRAFMRDPSRFFDACGYAARRSSWNGAWRTMDALCGEARRYAEGGDEIGRAGSGEDFAALLDSLVERLLGGDPVWVGLSVMYLEQLPWALAIARRVEERCGGRGPRVVLGGAAISALDLEELLRAFPAVHAAVPGEGELPAEALCRGVAWEQVPGLARAAPGGVRRNAPVPAAGLEMAATHALRPDFGDLPLAAYWNPEPVLPALFSRGCRWRRCRFCAHNFSFGDYRSKAAGDFARELAEERGRSGARHVYLADQYVGGADLARIAEALLAEGLDLRFHAMGRPDGEHTPERLALLRRAGCRWISWGVESGSQRLLDLVGKGTRVPVIEGVIRAAGEAGIANMLMMIFGLPTSTDEDLRLTFGLIERLADRIDIMTASRFVLFAGTAFAERAADHGLEIIGPREILRANGLAVHSTRLQFRERAADGSLRPPRAALEAAEWERRRAWLKDFALAERFSVEHTLLGFGRR